MSSFLSRSRRWSVLAGCIFLIFPAGRAFALDPSRSLYQYACRSWTIGEGLPANGINAINQSKDGFLWLGTQRGLVRFDGMEFKLLPLPYDQHFRYQAISSLSSSQDGGIWFGIQNGAFGHYRQDTGFTLLPDEPAISPDMNVQTLHEAADGSVWAGGGFSTTRFVRGKTNLTQPFPDDQGSITIYEDSNHRIWLANVGQKLNYWDGKKLVAFPDNSITNEFVFAVAEDSQGRLWLGTQLGLRCYDASLRRLEIPPAPGMVKALLADQHGVLWLGMADTGLWRYQDGVYSSFQKTDGLADDHVTTLFEDVEGSLWVGTRNGLSQLSDVRFPLYSKTEGLPDTAVHGVCASASGGLWVTGPAGISHFDGHHATNYSTNAGLNDTWIKTPFEASDGDLYLINGKREIEIFSGGHVVARHSYENQWPSAFTEDQQGVLVSVGRDLLRVSRTGLKPYEFEHDLPAFYWIWNLARCSDDSILVATANGIFRVKDGVFERVGTENGLPASTASYVFEDEEGVVWAGLSGGLARIAGGTVSAFTRKQGLLDDFISAIVPDNHGCLWVQSAQGIFRVSRSSLDDVASGKTNQLHCDVFNGMDSVKTTVAEDTEHTGCRTSDGRIWFPSSQGLIMVDPDHVPASTSSPIVHIQQIRINGKDWTPQAGTNAPPGEGELEVQFTAATFITPRDVRFRYRLEGYDDHWIEAGTRRSAFFTNLKPRNYRFVVQACNSDGVWSNERDSFAVRLLPHYYQTAWFLSLWGVLGAAGLAGAFGWRVSHLRRKQRTLEETNQLLETKVQKRTGELAEQRNLLRTLIDNLPDHFFVKDTEGRVVIDNIAHARTLGVNSPEEAVGKSDLERMNATDAEAQRAQEMLVLERGEIYNGEETIEEPQTGQGRWYQATKVPLRDAAGRITGLAGIRRDITERKEWEEQLQTLHRQLVEASRHAGMAEVATNVLHNVGNVLNSVNVSGSLLQNKLEHSAADRLTDLARLLHEHETDLAHFLTVDPKGQKFTNYVDALATHWQHDKIEMLKEASNMRDHLEHINQVVAGQQDYAKMAAVDEFVQVSEVVEDALRLHAIREAHRSIQLVREFSEVPQLCLDRHKLKQILVNLLQNAENACMESGREHRVITVRVRGSGADFVNIEVGDNGVGIAQENLIRIFSHGFTTRKNGHGFGLHSCALAAKELGGTLTADSPGPGQGTVFILRLPLTARSSNGVLKATGPIRRVAI